MTDEQLQHQIDICRDVYELWNEQVEISRLKRLDTLQEASHQCNHWHARLNYLEGLQKGRNSE